jgi:two-component sensor histidine kinase
VVDAGVELTGAQIGAFYRMDDEAQQSDSAGAKPYRLHALSGAQPEVHDQQPLAWSPEAFAPTFANGGTIRSDDITADPRHGRDTFHSGLPADGPPVRSYLAVPVLSRTGEAHGVLLFGHEKPGVFTERAERLVQGLAAQTAIALENGRLYQNAQREIEERRQAQAQQSLLIRELHHRVKNTLATVQAVVGATARSTSNIDEFYKAFVGRIISLANTHSLLTEAVWQTASLREILEKELSPYNDNTGARVLLEGRDVELPSDAAVPIGMAVHELTTNATKYGALSVDTGQVSVSWSSQPEEEGVRLKLCWQERGGPPVSQPERQGFGSRLLHRVLATQLNAKVDMAFEPEGLRVSIDAVLKQASPVNPKA